MEIGKIKLPTRTVNDFVANNRILDDWLGRKEGASVPSSMALLFYTARNTKILSLNTYCWKPQPEKDSWDHITMSETKSYFS